MAGLAIGLCNSTASDLAIWLEPWAEEFIAPPRGELALHVEADGVDPSPPELEETGDGLAIYAAAGTRIRVFIDGVEQDSGSASTTTPASSSLTTRDFVDAVFGEYPQARPHGRPFNGRSGWLGRLWTRLIG